VLKKRFSAKYNEQFIEFNKLMFLLAYS